LSGWIKATVWVSEIGDAGVTQSNEVDETAKLGIKRHYLPQFLLRQFRGESLFELDKATGRIEARKPSKAGQILDLYPEQLERTLFERTDNAAARIFRTKLYGREILPISDDEKRVLSEWLLLFAVRIPLNLQFCEHMTQEWEANPANSLKALDEEIDGIIACLKQQNAQDCGNAIRELGEDGFKATLHQLLRAKILAGEHLPATGQRLFEHMHLSGKHHEHTRRLYNLRWTWLKTNGEFVIGDNPLCRWDVQREVANYGLARRNLEITIPLTSRITLWMHRNYRHAEVAVCNRERTDELNQRQIISALKFAYGPSERSLAGKHFEW